MPAVQCLKAVSSSVWNPPFSRWAEFRLLVRRRGCNLDREPARNQTETHCQRRNGERKFLFSYSIFLRTKSNVKERKCVNSAGQPRNHKSVAQEVLAGRLNIQHSFSLTIHWILANFKKDDKNNKANLKISFSREKNKENLTHFEYWGNSTRSRCFCIQYYSTVLRYHFLLLVCWEAVHEYTNKWWTRKYTHLHSGFKIVGIFTIQISLYILEYTILFVST